MGHTQGKGCYCYVNGILTTQIARYAKNYKYIVMNNEAGMEHISRENLEGRHNDSRQRLLTQRRAGGRKNRKADAGMRTETQVHRTDHQPRTRRKAECRNEEIENGLNLLGVVPQDEQVYEYDCDGKPTVKLPEDSPVRKALNKIIKKLDLSE